MISRASRPERRMILVTRRSAGGPGETFPGLRRGPAARGAAAAPRAPPANQKTPPPAGARPGQQEALVPLPRCRDPLPWRRPEPPPVRAGLSRTAVRSALDSLEQQGRIIRHVGRGTQLAPADSLTS